MTLTFYCISAMSMTPFVFLIMNRMLCHFLILLILSIRTLNSLLRNKLTANILFGYINSKKIVLKIVKNIFITTNRPHNIGITTLLLVIDVCKFFWVPRQTVGRLGLRFTIPIQEDTKFNCLQTLEKGKHLNYFKTLVVGKAVYQI